MLRQPGVKAGIESQQKKCRNIMIAFTIPLTAIKFSTNKLYAGVHWTQRKEYKDSTALIVRSCLRKQNVAKIDSYPVEILYRFIFETRVLDTLNTAGMAKCIEDSFRSFGLLADDDPRYVTRSILEVVARKTASKQKEDIVEIEITSLPYVK